MLQQQFIHGKSENEGKKILERGGDCNAAQSLDLEFTNGLVQSAVNRL